MPLILVHNDLVKDPNHQWDDVEGVRYQYPPNYKNKIKSGETFVYYRGTWRADGKRGAAEYVGVGRIGRIWDVPPSADRPRTSWYCAIEDYERFEVSVPAKVDGLNLEQIPVNFFRNGVRTINTDLLETIMKFGGMAISGPDELRPAPLPVTNLSISISDNLIVPTYVLLPGDNSPPKTSFRMTRRAKEIGDWGEAVVLRYIQEAIAGCRDCAHRAEIGETPGWDIDYVDQAGELQRVEVKSTMAAAFTGIDLTAGELLAANTHGKNYWLYLVASCLTDNPKVQIVRDPASEFLSGNWLAKPTVFTVKFRGPKLQEDAG